MWEGLTFTQQGIWNPWKVGKKINVSSDESLINKPNEDIANGVVKTKLIRLTTCRAIIKDYIYIDLLLVECSWIHRTVDAWKQIL